MKIRCWTSALFFILLQGCGGGGGGSGSSSQSPAPTISLSAEAAKVAFGSDFNLTWSSTNTTSCTASGAWTGMLNVSGSMAVAANSAGTLSYALSCSGSGGAVSQTVQVVVPQPVQKSSYLNAKNINLGPQSAPVPPNATIFGFADFFQDGTYSMVTNSQVYSPNDPSTANDFGAIQFWKMTAAGWVDHTTDILSDTVGCLAARKIVVADFNGDGKPDVFISCHGFDASPFPGEHTHLLLSQPDGSYKNTTLPFVCFCHGASAADVHGNGYADIVVVDPSVAKEPFYLVNNHDGTFTQDFTRMPASVLKFSYPDETTTFGQEIYTTELIDFDDTGRFDVFFGANEPTGQSPTVPISSPQYYVSSIYKNDGNNNFLESSRIQLPVPDLTYGLPLDIIYLKGKIVLLRIISNPASPYGFYGGMELQEISYPALNSTILYAHTGVIAPSGADYFPFMVPYQGKIVPQNAAYAVSVMP